MSTEERLLIVTEADLVSGASAQAFPVQIGRYRVLGKLGEGGVGVVFEAHDPQLDRRVAIKLLHGVRPDVAKRERILREARALARVVHPNIVAAHDAGYHEDDLFVVMELVDGVTLGEWLKERARTVGEICAAFAQAGRGLAAAHAGGLVHRDFKPANVLVGKDGRVRVADFGLARMLDADRDEAQTGSGSDSAPGFLATATGTLLGTPAYMAPEQHAGQRADERADQFAFCVALHEALHGVRPFQGATFEALSRNVRDGRMIDDPERRRLPSWLRALVARGLAVDPARRHASMMALVAALERGGGRRRRLLVAVIAGAAVLAAAVVAARGPDSPMCRSAPGELAAVWDAAARSRLTTAFAATARPHAAETTTRVARLLDDYGAAWVAMRTGACEATHFRGTQSAAALDLRMRCLDRRLSGLRAAVALYTDGATPDVVDRATAIASDLDAIGDCEHPDEVAAADPPAAAALRSRLTEAGVLRRAGRYRDALAEVTPVVGAARPLGRTGLLAEALHLEGRLLWDLGQSAVGEAQLREALRVAGEAHDDARAAAVAIELASFAGSGKVRLDEVTALQPFVDAALARAGAGDALRSRWLTVLGIVDNRAARFAEARDHLEQAVAMKERVYGPDHPEVANTLNHLARVAGNMSDYKEGYRLRARALAIQEKALGPEHPDVATTLNGLGLSLNALGRYTEAAAAYERALRIDERMMGRASLATAETLIGLGSVLMEQGDNARARAVLEEATATREALLGREHADLMKPLRFLAQATAATGDREGARRILVRALAIAEKIYGPDYPETAATLSSLGVLAYQQGRYEEALAYMQRGLAAMEKTILPGHPTLASKRVSLGMIYLHLGRYDEAAASLARAREIYAGSLGATHVDVAYALDGLGELAQARGEHAEAIARFEEALRLRVDGHAKQALVADTKSRLARSLWATGDRSRAVRVATEARAVYASDASRADELADLDRWLARHR